MVGIYVGTVPTAKKKKEKKKKKRGGTVEWPPLTIKKWLKIKDYSY